MLRGSICLSDIPKELIKKVKCKDGKERCFLNFAIFKRKEPATFGDITYTHFMSCAPKKEERKEDVRYIIADLSETVDSNKYPSSTEVEAAPSVSQDDDLDLPF